MSSEEQNERSAEPGAQTPAGQVPEQGGAPSRESLVPPSDSPSAGAAPTDADTADQARVPGQAVAGQGGVLPEAFVAHPLGGPAAPTAEDADFAYPLGLVPPPADPLDGDRPPSDAELTARVRAGDDSAYEEIYRRHAAAVRRYARTCCRDSFTAEDLAGEVFARTLQALKAGKGPEFAVRAYLLTAVRNVAAAWGRTGQREQLIDDFGVFEQSSTAAAIDFDLADPGADAWAMAMADRRMVMQAFVELPEDDRVLLWHTEVEQESPKAVAVLLGKTANATAVQAHRARSRLAAAFLQAHVSGSQEQGCEEYANQLGRYARGALRKRAATEVGTHLRDCDRCTAALLELVDINHGLRLVLPGGVLVWIGAGAFSAVAAALGAGAVVGGAAAGGAAAASGAGAAGAGAAGAAAGAAGAGAAGSASGAAGAGGSSAGAAVGEGLGTAGKAAIVAGVVVAAAAAVAFALAGSPGSKPVAAAPVVPGASPSSSSAVAPPPPTSGAPARSVPTPSPAAPTSASPTRAQAPTAAPTTPAPSPTPDAPTPGAPTPEPSPSVPLAGAPSSPAAPGIPTPVVPTPSLPPVSTPTPSPSPPPPPASFWLDTLPFSRHGQRVPPGPSIDRDDSDWLLQRHYLGIDGTAYNDGLSVHAPATVTIDLNRACSAFDAVVGLDDLTMSPGRFRFSVLDGDGNQLWTSAALRAGQRAVPVHVPLAGLHQIQLAVTPQDGDFWSEANLADWAQAHITC